MKKYIKLALVCFAVFGLFVIGNTLKADQQPICSTFSLYHPLNSYKTIGDYCYCDGVITNYWAEPCEDVLYTSDCHDRICGDIACCDYPPPS